MQPVLIDRDARADAEINAVCNAVRIAGDIRVQRVNALHDDELIALSAERSAGFELLLRGEIEARQLDLLTAGKLLELRVQQVGIEPQRGFVIGLSELIDDIGIARAVGVVIVHGKRVRFKSGGVEDLLKAAGGRSLAGAGRP